MKIGQINVPYETLHAVYCYFCRENTKGRNRLITSSITLSTTVFSPEKPTTENRWVISRFLSELGPRQYETIVNQLGSSHFDDSLVLILRWFVLGPFGNFSAQVRTHCIVTTWASPSKN